MIGSISKPDKRYLLTAAVLLVLLSILPANSAYAGWPEVDKLLAADGAASDYFGYSVSVSGDYAIVGADHDDDNGSDSGSAYIFYYDGTSWFEQAKLLASGGASDYFGRSVFISGDRAIVGAHFGDGIEVNSGLAYIFKRYGTSWSRHKLTALDGAVNDFFGYSVSISGDYAIVGAYGDLVSSGSAYIFNRIGARWIEQAKLLAADFFAGDNFGRSVSISGDYAIIGAWGDDDNGTDSGSAYIFKRDGTSWIQQAKLLASDAAAGDNFGISVSLSGDYGIVGAYWDDDKGSAYIFFYNGTSWSEQAKLTASDGANNDRFGFSVSISGDYAVIGADYDDDNGSYSGSAYIFKRDGTSWSQQAKLIAADGAAGDWFGYSVSVSGDYAIVGASGDDDNGSASGSAYMYLRLPDPEIHGTKWHDIDVDGRFVEDTDEGEEGMQGWRIYIDENENGQFDAGEANDITDANGNYVLIAPAAGTWLLAEENRSCWEQTYPGGDGTYSVTLKVGEIAGGYNFGNARPGEIHPSVWQQQEQDKLLASDGAVGDSFGYSVSVSGDYTVVGANGDDSYTGSAYIFAHNDADCSDWDEAAKLTASDGAAYDRFGFSVSVSGAYAIVGAFRDDDNSGSGYIFYYDGSSWSQQAKLVASDGAADDYFGISVSMSGDYAIVGACGDDDNGADSGSAYIFKRSGTSWSEQAKLVGSDGAAGDAFGYSVSVSGDYAIVGAYRDDDKGSDSGSAHIFKRDGSSWSQQAKLTASDGAASDCFGGSVSISGGYAIVGAFYDDDNGSNSGSAYIFFYNGTSWSQQGKLLAADGAADDYFGNSVSVSGDYAIVGAYGDDDNGSYSGSAYIFERSGTSWSEQAKWVSSDGAASDYFGYSVSISGDYAIAGANRDDDNAGDCGSAYMFGKVLCPSMDRTGDCFVDFKDFAIMAGQWLEGAK